MFNAYKNNHAYTDLLSKVLSIELFFSSDKHTMSSKEYRPLITSRLNQSIRPEDVEEDNRNTSCIANGSQFQWKLWCAVVCPAVFTAVALVFVCIILSLPVSHSSGIATIKVIILLNKCQASAD